MADIQRGLILRDDVAHWDGVTRTGSRVDATGGTITALNFGDEVDVLQVFGNGTNKTKLTISDAVARLGGANATLLFSIGTWTIDSDLTIPANVTCHFPFGSILSVDSGKTLTINGFVQAGIYQVFSGSGTTTGSFKNKELYPQWWGALADNSNDDTQAIKDAISSVPNGGIIALPPSDLAYRITTGNIDLPTNKAIHIRGEDTDIKHNSTTNTDYIFGIDFGTSATSPKSQISGLRCTTVTNGNGIAIRIYGTNHQTFRDIFASGFDKAFAIRNDATDDFSEAHHFENIDLRGNNNGFHYSIGSGNASFATQYYSNVRIALVGAAAAVPYGFKLEQNADIYRSTFSGMTIFPAINDGVGFYCDGKMRNCRGSINIEGNTAGITGNTGILIDTNATLIHVDINSDIRGTIANDFTINTSEAISGWRTSSLSNIDATIIKASKLSGISAVVEADLTTFRMIEKVTSAGVYQWLTAAATPPEFVDSSTGNLSPIRLLDVGNTEVTATDGDATPTVADITRLLLSQTSGTKTITDFDDGIDGQTLVCRFIQSSFATTIDHNVNIVLSGSVDYVPANNNSTLTLMCYGGTVWREIGRMAT